MGISPQLRRSGDLALEAQIRLKRENESSGLKRQKHASGALLQLVDTFLQTLPRLASLPCDLAPAITSHGGIKWHASRFVTGSVQGHQNGDDPRRRFGSEYASM
jgi:hypothetical protein